MTPAVLTKTSQDKKEASEQFKPLVGLVLSEEEAHDFIDSKFSLVAGGLTIAIMEVSTGLITRTMNQREAQIYLARPEKERQSASHKLALFRTHLGATIR